MSDDPVLRALELLRESADLTALVGTRIYPDLAPQDAALPHVTYTVIGESEVEDLRGPSGLGRTRLQIDAWTRSYAQARDVGKAIRAALVGLARGDLIRVRLVPGDSGSVRYEPPTDASERPAWRARRDFYLHHNVEPTNRLIGA